MSVITKVTTYDFRFPTSATFSGSDAMNPDPDYSSAYVVISTDAGDSGNGFVFTIGRGNDVVVRAIDSMSETLIGRNVEELLDNMRLAWDLFVRDSQLRWLGPEKGVEHMAIGAVLSALWDLKAKRAGKPLWLLLSEMEPEELVATLDFRYLTDALTPQEAIEVMGFKQIKLKVGQNLEDDLRRLKLAREAVGPDIAIAVDANQVWDVPQAIEWIGKFKDYDLAWVEEPTCPDDVLGHAAIQKAIDPIPVATGEQMQNRVMYKQYLQAGSFKVMQIDATRVAGPQEIVLEYLLAKKFGVKVCPHAGGVGLCEAISQLAMFDYVSVSGEMEDRVVEYVDNQHEYFVHPTVIKNGRYVAPLAPGNGTEMKLDECMKYLHKD